MQSAWQAVILGSSEFLMNEPKVGKNEEKLFFADMDKQCVDV